MSSSGAYVEGMSTSMWSLGRPRAFSVFGFMRAPGAYAWYIRYFAVVLLLHVGEQRRVAQVGLATGASILSLGLTGGLFLIPYILFFVAHEGVWYGRVIQNGL